MPVQEQSWTASTKAQTQNRLGPEEEGGWGWSAFKDPGTPPRRFHHSGACKTLLKCAPPPRKEEVEEQIKGQVRQNQSDLPCPNTHTCTHSLVPGLSPAVLRGRKTMRKTMRPFPG